MIDKKVLNEIEDILEECFNHFDKNIDAEYIEGRCIPNFEMQMVTRIDPILTLLEKERVDEYRRKCKAS